MEKSDLYRYRLLGKVSSYVLENGPLVPRLPKYLKIERNRNAGKVITPFLLRGRANDSEPWSERILTGLIHYQTVGAAQLYYGDHLSSGTKSFMVIKIMPVVGLIEIHYFYGYFPFAENVRNDLLWKVSQQKTGAQLHPRS